MLLDERFELFDRVALGTEKDGEFVACLRALESWAIVIERVRPIGVGLFRYDKDRRPIETCDEALRVVERTLKLSCGSLGCRCRGTDAMTTPTGAQPDALKLRRLQRSVRRQPPCNACPRHTVLLDNSPRCQNSFGFS